MAKTEKRKTVHYVYRWESDYTGNDTGCVTAWIEFEHHKSKELYRKDVKFELAEAYGESLINQLKKDTIY